MFILFLYNSDNLDNSSRTKFGTVVSGIFLILGFPPKLIIFSSSLYSVSGVSSSVK